MPEGHCATSVSYLVLSYQQNKPWASTDEACSDEELNVFSDNLNSPVASDSIPWEYTGLGEQQDYHYPKKETVHFILSISQAPEVSFLICTVTNYIPCKTFWIRM